MTAPHQRSDIGAGVGTGWEITSTMIGGIAAGGGLGLLVDWLLSTPHVFTAVGFVAGAAGAVYVIWLRYGKGESGGG